MIDIKALDRDDQNPKTGKPFREDYRESLKARGEDPSEVDKLLEINQRRKQYLTEMETRKAEQNKVGQEIAQKKKAKEDATEILEQMQKLAADVKEFEKQAHAAQEDLHEKLLRLPNYLHPDVPVGKGEEDNKEIRQEGEKPNFSFKPKEHWEIGENLQSLDFERAGKVTGARFAFLRKGLARMERALIQFMMDLHAEEHDYEEMIPPFIVNSQSLQGTSQFPKFKEDVFSLEDTDYYLVPTAEVPVTNFYAQETLKESDLPQKFVAYTPCFRSEAGSYGKDTKGLIRQHQFNKVELVMFTRPEESYEMHEKLTSHAEEVLKRLKLHYRLMSLCSADIGFGAAKCYDIEVWLPGQEKYREISSCSNFEDFQARRANIRFKPEGQKIKPQFVHTLNGSGLAVGRTLIAIVENYQQEDGSIQVPDVLKPYMHGLHLITN